MSRSFAIDGLDPFDALEQRLSLSAVTSTVTVGDASRPPTPSRTPVRSRVRIPRSSIRPCPRRVRSGPAEPVK